MQNDIKNTPFTKAEKPVDNRMQNGQFGRGNCANPKGRPLKGLSITDCLRQVFEDEPGLKKVIVDVIIEKVIEGNFEMIKLIWAYLDGTPIARQEARDTRGDEALDKLKEVLDAQIEINRRSATS